MNLGYTGHLELPMFERNIVHINITDYMAQIEEQRDSAIRGRPFVIGAENKARSIALGVSHTAFSEGIWPGMNIREARKRCRDLRVLAPDYERYKNTNDEIIRIAYTFTPNIEALGGGHCFLDIAGTRLLFGQPVDCANRIRAAIIEKLGLKPSVALAVNKLVSKVGSRVVKPYGFVAVRSGDERPYLAPQVITILPGVGRKLNERLSVLNVKTIGELSEFTDIEARILGIHGVLLRDRARGIDEQQLNPKSPDERTMSGSIHFDTDTNDVSEIESHLLSLIEELGLKLRSDGLYAKTLEITANYTDGLRNTIKSNLPDHACFDTDFLEPCRRIIEKILTRRVRIRSFSVELKKLWSSGGQLDLFIPENEEKKNAVQKAVDTIRMKYGSATVKIGAALVS
jgi:DNA polymerase-4